MSFFQRLSVGMAFAVCIVCATAYLMWQRAEELERAASNSSRAEQAMMEADKLLAQFIAMETGARSFIITGDSAHLELYARTVGEVPLALKRLQSLMRPLSARNAEVVNFLETALDKKIMESNQAIAVRRSQGIKISAFVIIRGKAANIADTLTALIQGLQRETREALLRQNADLTQQYTQLVAQIALPGMALAIAVVLGSVFWASMAQRAALRPLVQGMERLALGDWRARVPPPRAADLKPAAAALNALGERLLATQDKSLQNEDFYADIVHGTPEAISVWRARRNGYGKITDFECLFTNNAWTTAYKLPPDSLNGRALCAALPDFQPYLTRCALVVEQNQSMSLDHAVEGKQYRLLVSKMRDGILIRLRD
jgi:CHASE3 domain sensor protein